MNDAGNFVIVQLARMSERGNPSAPDPETIRYLTHAFRGEFRAAGVMRVDEPAVPAVAARPVFPPATASSSPAKP